MGLYTRESKDRVREAVDFLELVSAHTELPDGRIHFDPVPVFVGPVPGWKGPALGARPVGGADPANAASQSADVAPTPRHGARRKSKAARHVATEIKAQKLIAAKTLQPKLDNSDNIKQDPAVH